MLRLDTTVFVLIDVQGRLAEIVHESKAMLDALGRLVRGVVTLQVPVVWTEQNPERMGPTRPEIASLMPAQKPLAKMSFSCCGAPAFTAALEAVGRPQVLLAGIETHVCVYQTAADLLTRGYEVEVVADAVSSRTAANKAVGLEKIRDLGGRITCVETALFELLRSAEHPAFRAVLGIVK